MPGSVILAGARTPIGKLSGASGRVQRHGPRRLRHRRRAERAGVAPDQVDYVFMGQVLQAGQGQITARQAADKGRDPHVGARHHRQQGLPVGAQHASTSPTC